MYIQRVSFKRQRKPGKVEQSRFIQGTQAKSYWKQIKVIGWNRRYFDFGDGKIINSEFLKH